ncbi:hypothetical protein [Vogesella sp. LIG4]|uniref:hypothetical protein n=1 Tax=Vogesella sp. LIG4 TaxID=1192162 RepID=UPI0012FE79F7|nr:hypothetical protein [Vogesella sp. LIG4]
MIENNRHIHWVVAKDTGETFPLSIKLESLPKKIIINSFDELNSPLPDLPSKIVKIESTPKNSNRGRKPKVLKNDICRALLHDFASFEEATEKHPFLDDIITGACSLDYGGTRGLVKEDIFIIISNAEQIETQTIREITWASESHSRKLSSAARICVNTITSHLKKQHGHHKEIG